ncbi:DUF4089 domain-containing protein [Parasphingorhabdus sp.]|uniref:DUF4089 domain-containing protein n=1 Tax=Parasphingorhabdus sp. TaxID=2709688 RepID=UPI003A92CAAD
MDSEEEKSFQKPTRSSVRSRLAEAGYEVPDNCIDGIIENLVVLQKHAQTVRRLPLDERHELAPKYFP